MVILWDGKRNHKVILYSHLSLKKERGYMICGIYCIENKINNKKYIGQSIDIEKRWAVHKVELNNNNHVNKHLQRSWNKHGENSFEFYIIEICESKMLNKREKYWIEYFDSYTNGFNLTLGGDGGNTISKYTDEQLEKYKRKKRQIHSKTSLKAEDAPRSKLNNSQVLKIIDRLLSGDYNADIARDYNVSPSTIHDIRVHNSWNSLTDGIEFPHSSKVLAKGVKGKAVNQYTKDGEFIATYINAREAEKITGCPFKNISAVCKGQKHTCLGYVWRFVDDSI